MASLTYTYDCGNGLTFEVTLDFTRLAHTEVIVEVVAPTCTKTGLIEGKHCSSCGKVLVAQETIDALGHDLIYHDVKSPTCKEIGWEAYDTC